MKGSPPLTPAVKPWCPTCLSLEGAICRVAQSESDKPCELYCSPLGKESPLLVADRVLDGTPCGPYEADLCVYGRCQKIGCDGIIGSAAKEDRCGVCSGDGKTCRVVKGDFSHSRGTALKDSSKRSINSDWKIELPGEFQIAGTTVRYVRRGLWEKFSAKGPTTVPLHLMVLLFHDQNYGIHYEYTIPVNQSSENQSEPAKPQDALFLWTHSGWEGCSVQCGGATVSRVQREVRVLWTKQSTLCPPLFLTSKCDVCPHTPTVKTTDCGTWSTLLCYDLSTLSLFDKCDMAHLVIDKCTHTPLRERRTIVSCTRIVNKTTTLVNDSDCPQASRPEPQVRRCNSHPCQSRVSN
ncbi:mCG2186 [Mus musculus]|nr:mCG2186 [Mus musculus]